MPDKKKKLIIKPKKAKPKTLRIKEGPRTKAQTHEVSHDPDGKKYSVKELKQLGVWRYMTGKQMSHEITTRRRNDDEDAKKRREKSKKQNQRH